MKNTLRKLSGLALGVGIVMSSTAAYAETLSDALKWAYQDNPSLNVARANIRSVTENVHVQNAARRPQVNLSGSFARSNTELYAGNWQQNDQLAASVNASLLLYDGGKTELAVQSIVATSKAQQYQLLATEQQILLATVRGYLDVLRDRELVASSRNNIKTLEASLSSARVAYDAGAATVTELAQTEAGLAQGRAQLAVAIANLERSEASYQELTGRKPGKLQAVGGLSNLPKSLDAAIAQAKKISPLVMASKELERGALLDLRRAQRGRYPSVSASASSSITNPLNNTEPTQSNQLGVSVNVPLYNGGSIAALERQAQATLEARAAETASTYASLAQQVSNSWAYLINSRSVVEANRQVVEAQKLADESSAVEYEFGATTIVDRLETEQDLMDARANLTSSLYDNEFASYQLLASMGGLTIDAMGLKFPKIDPLQIETARPQQSEKAKQVEQISDRWSN